MSRLKSEKVSKWDVLFPDSLKEYEEFLDFLITRAKNEPKSDDCPFIISTGWGLLQGFIDGLRSSGPKKMLKSRLAKMRRQFDFVFNRILSKKWNDKNDLSSLRDHKRQLERVLAEVKLNETDKEQVQNSIADVDSDISKLKPSKCDECRFWIEQSTGGWICRKYKSVETCDAYELNRSYVISGECIDYIIYIFDEIIEYIKHPEVYENADVISSISYVLNCVKEQIAGLEELNRQAFEINDLIGNV